MVDNDNEPRLVACLCCLPDLSWWAFSSMPGALALVFDSNYSSHFCKEPGPGNQPPFLVFLGLCDSKELLPSWGVTVCVPEDNQVKGRHKHLRLKIRIFGKKKVPLLNSAWETIWTRIFINQLTTFHNENRRGTVWEFEQIFIKSHINNHFQLFPDSFIRVPCLTFENHMFLSGWGC